MGKQVAYSLEFDPITLKRLVSECGFTQQEFAAKALNGEGGESVLNLIVNRGYSPSRIPNYRKLIEAFITGNEKALAWLGANKMKLSDIWLPLGQEMRQAQHAGISDKKWVNRKIRAMVPGDPGDLNKTEVEREMLTLATMKHFKIFKNPFLNDIELADIYLSEDHRYIEAAMMDAAKHSGLLAVIGEVGSGKTTMRRKVFSELRKDDSIRIIFPRIIDKTRITGASICDAIILDLDPDAKPKLKLEQKSRQVEKMLLERSKAGSRMVMIIEEAHDLKECPRALKLFKRFNEIEDGFKKVLGVILIGQPELRDLFNAQDHYDMRETIWRFQVALIEGLNGNLKDYLSLKFKRIGADVKNVISDEGIKALASRLTIGDGKGRKISQAYPLTVNNYITRAMNAACDMGEALVTDDVINTL